MPLRAILVLLLHAAPIFIPNVPHLRDLIALNINNLRMITSLHEEDVFFAVRYTSLFSTSDIHTF